MAVHLRTLGHIDLRDDAGVELRGLLTQPKRLAVLVYLASTAATRMCRRDTLLAMFWPESDAERARAALRQSLHFIRQALGDVVVTRGADEIGVEPGSIVLDAARLDELAAEGRHDEVVAIYTGDFLDGFFVKGAPAFERWVDGERERIRRRVAESAWAVVETKLDASDFRGAREVAERAVRLSADNEVAIRRFIALLARSGDHAAAANVYQEFAAELASEFGVQPSRETRALVKSLAEPRVTPAAGVVLEGQASRFKGDGMAATPAAPVVAASKRSVWKRGWAIAAALVLVASIALMRFDVQRAHAEMDANRVAVLPFVVRGSPELRYLHDGLPLLLSTRLDGMVRLNAVDMRAILLDQSRRGGDSLSADAARATAERFGARFYIVGTAVGTAKALQLDVSLHDRARGDAAIARTQATGREADLVSLVDQIAAQLLADRFREDGGLVAEMAARTTDSFVALKAWLQGESALAAGRYGAAETSFKDAIAADSLFAMAYYRLSVAATWSGNIEAAGPAATRAAQLSERLPPSARTIVRAFLASRTGRYVDAERAERALLAERPASIDVWFDLGELLYHANPARGRPITEAQEAFEQLLRMDAKSFAAMAHLVRLAAVREDKTALDSLSRAALAGEPDGPHRAELLLLRAIELNDANARRDFLAMPMQLTLLDAMWRAAEYTDGLPEMEAFATSLIARATSNELRTALFLFLSHVAIGRERFAVAKTYIDSLAAYAPHYAAVTASIAALHPAVSSADRSAGIARARARFASLTDVPESGRVYAGTTRTDRTSPYDRVEEALLALAAGDTSIARRELARRPVLLDETGRVRLELAIASTAEARTAAIKSAMALDSLYGNSYATQIPLAPRALFQLDFARVLAVVGRPADALSRLSTVPEDFGFNVTYLAEVHRRRAALLSALGNERAAATERERAARVVR